MPDRSLAARPWVRRAREDLRVAAAETPLLAAWQRCFFAQQAAEKILKAALTYVGVKVPRIHDLIEIYSRLPSKWPTASVDLGRLSTWAVEPRYPVRRNPTVRDARRAVTDADEIVGATLREMRKRGYRAR